MNIDVLHNYFSKSFNAVAEMLLPYYVKCDIENLKQSTEASLLRHFASESIQAPP